MSTGLSKIGAHSLESRQKTEKMPFFVYQLVEIQGARNRKQTKNGGNVSFLSTGLSKFGPRGLESRQKTGEMTLFCLPDSPKLGRTDSKAEQNHPKMKKYSTRFHRRNARLVTNVANQTQKQIRHGRRQCQNFHCDRKAAMTPPINHVPLSAFAPTQVANISQSEVPRASFGTLII